MFSSIVAISDTACSGSRVAICSLIRPTSACGLYPACVRTMRFCPPFANCDALKYIIGKFRISTLSPSALLRVCGTIPMIVSDAAF